jgi:hypothetical protein
MTGFAGSWAGRTVGLLLVFLALTGCRQHLVELPRTGISVAIGEGTVFFVRWKGGPAVMICTDFSPRSDRAPVHTDHTSHNAYPPLVSREGGSQSSGDGRRFEWSVETADGRSIKCRLDEKEYDASKGTLFLVKTKGGKTEVEQLAKVLSSVPADSRSVEEFVRKDGTVSKFLGIKAD